MKYLTALLLVCLLLTGCRAEVPPAEPTIHTESTTAPSPTPAGLWEPGSPLEVQTGGAVRVYPLTIPYAYDLRTMGENLLLLSGPDRTTLTLLTGEALHVTASVTLDRFYSAQELTVSTNGLSYFDSSRWQVVVLDASLKEIRHIDLPVGDVRTPLLTADADTLYYCSGTAIRAWDLTTDIHRLVTEMTEEVSLVGLFLEDSLLQCRIGEKTQVLDPRNGSLLWEGPELTLATAADRYYACFPTGCVQALVFGQGEGSAQALTPADLDAYAAFLPRQNAAVTATQVSDSQIRLDYYDLTCGTRKSCLPLDSTSLPLAFRGTSEGWVYILMDQPSAIYRWDPEAPAVNDGTIYTGPYYSPEVPDYHGLLRCQALAEEIGQRYGIRILLWDESLTSPPWDYIFEAEYLVPVLERELQRLDARLGQFPEGFLETTAANFSSLSICLVRSLTGTPESGSLETADGVQYLIGTDAYIALAVGETGEKALYHELYHVMETQILNKSIALDQWNKLNPVDFSYAYSYTANETRDVGSFLDPDIRSFVDRYAMSFPKEDRARIFEYAMVSGSQELFAASPLQFKLKQLCLGIREAYGLKKSPEVFPWEQYLLQSLAPSK